MKLRVFLPLLCIGVSAKAQTRFYPYFDKTAWGVANERKEVVIAPQFDTIICERGGVLKLGHSKNVSTTSGAVIFPDTYTQLEMIKGAAEIKATTAGGEEVLLSIKTGKLAGSKAFTRILSYCGCQQAFYAVKIGDKVGVYNVATDAMAVQPEYDNVEFMGGGWTGMVDVVTGNKHGVLEVASGKLVLPVEYEQLEWDVFSSKKEVKATAASGIIYTMDETGAVLLADSSIVKARIAAAKPKKPATQARTTLVKHMETPEPGGSIMVNTSLKAEDRANGLSVEKVSDDSWKVTTRYMDYNDKSAAETLELTGYSQLKPIEYRKTNKGSAKLMAVKEGKAGIIDATGKVLLAFNYDSIDCERSRYWVYTSLNGKTGLVRTSTLIEVKKPVLKQVIKNVISLSAFLVEMPDGKKGYMDEENGTLYIPGVVE
ncbi:WG containing repeat-containing protein [Filimonas lacunae]|uniref:WG containing repeat-containing protein n=1 Tax=Filimonas lacunae TaxID=477680 RepID=A0A173MC81_9BACT|nr:WG repeat-containing protein [Filimonas lacunae]BAV05110.1 hypothetical protein FLA_1117 [Filimonas lacunae]SIT34217.1 WG containing repeat-containing protein [Filimonas lacunae]